MTSRPGPRSAGIELPSELADESFSVYDHPKVLVLRNTARLGSAELERRIRAALPTHPITRHQLLLAQAQVPLVSSPLVVRSSWLATLLVVTVVELLGLAAWALLAGAMGEARLGLWALAKPVGVLLAGLALLVGGEHRLAAVHRGHGAGGGGGPASRRGARLAADASPFPPFGKSW